MELDIRGARSDSTVSMAWSELCQFYKTVCELVLKPEEYADIEFNEQQNTDSSKQLFESIKYLNQVLISRFQVGKNQQKRRIELLSDSLSDVFNGADTNALSLQSLNNWKLSIIDTPLAVTAERITNLFDMYIPLLSDLIEHQPPVNNQDVDFKFSELQQQIHTVSELMHLSAEDIDNINIVSQGTPSQHQLLQACQQIIIYLLDDLRVEQRVFEQFSDKLSHINQSLTTCHKRYNELHVDHYQQLQANNDAIKLECLNIEDCLDENTDMAISKKFTERATSKLGLYIVERERLDHQHKGHIEQFLNKVNELSSQLFQALKEHKQQLYRRRKSAYIDTLTRLPNRASYDKYIKQQLSLPSVSRSEMLIMLVDLDNFKPINDNFGHPIGDKTLKVVARALNHTVPDNAFVCRWGGDEFVIAIANDDPNKNTLLADKLCTSIRCLPLKFKHNTISLTASIGITRITPTDTANSVIKRVDKALYEAKRNGGNRSSFLASHSQGKT